VTLAFDPAHFEDVGEISGEKKLERDLERGLGIVADTQPMDQHRISQDPTPFHLDLIARQLDRAAMLVQIRISQVYPELRFVIARVGIQEVRRAPVDPEFEMAEVARVSMEKAQRLEWVVENIAADVEDGKALPVGQHTRGAA
jgi:hypothetical protein